MGYQRALGFPLALGRSYPRASLTTKALTTLQYSKITWFKVKI